MHKGLSNNSVDIRESNVHQIAKTAKYSTLTNTTDINQFQTSALQIMSQNAYTEGQKLQEVPSVINAINSDTKVLQFVVISGPAIKLNAQKLQELKGK